MRSTPYGLVPALVLLALVSACAVTPISEANGHVSLDLRGRGDALWQKADAMAEGYCETLGLKAGPRQVHDTGWADPGHWFIEYDCVKGSYR